MERVERSRLLGGLAALLAVAGIIGMSIQASSAPDPVAANASADQFSAERAFAHVEQLGSAVHPTGSAAADDVRAYIVRTLNQLGLATRVQDDIGANQPSNYARVRNVVATLPGNEPTGRLFLFAHYDSAPASFGASDDGIGVAVLLDLARVLTAEPRPRNDIVFVLTEGEESCLCGAEAFASRDPAAAEGGLFLNFDNRGSSGPGIMYRTSPGNSALIAVYQAAVPYPWASSFAAEVNRRLPGDTDFSALIHSGKFVGFDSAQIDDSAIYHTPQDRPEYVDKAGLQHVGANALALSRALGAAGLSPLLVDSGSDASYFSAFSVLISYPGWLIGPLAGLAALAIVALAVLARRRGITSWPRLIAGLALTLVPMVLGPAVAQLLWYLLVAVRPGYANMLDPWQPGFFRAAVFAVVVAIVLAWYGLFRPRVGPWGLIIAGLGWLAGLGVVLAVVAPSGSYLVTLPSLAGSAGCAVAIIARRPAAQLAALVTGAAVGIVILLPMLLALFAAVGLTLGMVPAFVVVLLTLVVLPVVEWIYPGLAQRPPDEAVARVRTVRSKQHRWWAVAPSLAAILLGGSLVITGLAVDRFDQAHPAPVQLNYVLDADTGQARWFSDDGHPDPWVAQFVSGEPNTHAGFWPLDDGVPTGPARAANLAVPTVTVLADTSSDGQRTVTLNITPHRSSNRLWLALPDVMPTRATVAGREVQLAELDGQFFVAFYGSPPTGIDVQLVLRGTDPVKVHVGDNSQGLDGIPGYVPRPDGLGLTGARGSDIVTVGKTYAL